MGTSLPYVFDGNSFVEVYFSLIGLNGNLCGDWGLKSWRPKNSMSFFSPSNWGLSMAFGGGIQGLGVVVGGVAKRSFSLNFLRLSLCSCKSWPRGLLPPKKNDKGGGGGRLFEGGGGRGLGRGRGVVVVVVVSTSFFFLLKYDSTMDTASGLFKKAETMFSSTSNGLFLLLNNWRLYLLFSSEWGSDKSLWKITAGFH